MTALPPEKGRVDTGYPPLKSQHVEKAPCPRPDRPSARHHRVAGSLPRNSMGPELSCGSVVAPLFQPVRARETPPCLHTTSRCPAQWAWGAGGGGGGSDQHIPRYGNPNAPPPPPRRP